MCNCLFLCVEPTKWSNRRRLAIEVGIVAGVMAVAIAHEQRANHLRVSTTIMVAVEEVVDVVIGDMLHSRINSISSDLRVTEGEIVDTIRLDDVRVQ